MNFPIQECFYSIQGEGYHFGKPSYFIRFKGCHIKCHWCDTKSSWVIEKKDFISIHKIISNINKNIKIIILTGGEPMMWNLYPLIKILKIKGHSVHIETSGSYPIKHNFIDWITISPKKNKMPLKENYEKINELKVVISEKNDFIFAENQANLIKKDCKFFLQPEWNKSKEIIPWIISYIKKNSKWRISIQAHKLLNIP